VVLGVELFSSFEFRAMGQGSGVSGLAGGMGKRMHFGRILGDSRRFPARNRSHSYGDAGVWVHARAFAGYQSIRGRDWFD
jgi:hypothetical protein